MSETLKPCPFCGKKNFGFGTREINMSIDSNHITYIAFIICECNGGYITKEWYETEEEAKAACIKGWNTRAGCTCNEVVD